MKKIIIDAMLFAVQAHTDQFRDGGKDFIVHPAQTAAIIYQVTNDSELIAAAWLHDTLEDTDTTYPVLAAKFGQRVADLVNEVTHEVSKKGNYFPRLHSREAIMLKLADRLANVSDMKSWSEKRKAAYLKKTKFWKDSDD